MKHILIILNFRRCQMMKLEADAKIESAGLAQAKQASLVDRLQVRINNFWNLNNLRNFESFNVQTLS